MVRLCGKSLLYLPPEYAPCALILPTCLRATAHFLTQHLETRGIFRIPGSIRIVNTLYDYYCFAESETANITDTVRCTTLPMHINTSVHDVASTFKRLLSVLPGGILGSLSLFDALIAIHSQLRGDPEFPRTKQTRVRARLIALAIGTVKSNFQRDLICAVFGLLSLVGRVAEVAPREDTNGRPLPTGDLMGYSALGIVFGPLLLGDLLDQYTMKLATPDSGLLVLPLTPPKLRKDHFKSRNIDKKTIGPPTVNKILVANNITEMLITNWRDVVRQMKALGIQQRNDLPSSSQLRAGSLRQSSSEPFILRKLQSREDRATEENPINHNQREESPELENPTQGIRRQRPRKRISSTSNRLSTRASLKLLSPTTEENFVDEDAHYVRQALPKSPQARHESPGQRLSSNSLRSHPGSISDGSFLEADQRYLQNPARTPKQSKVGGLSRNSPKEARAQGGQESSLADSPRISVDQVPPRCSSKSRSEGGYLDSPCPAGSFAVARNIRDTLPIKERGPSEPRVTQRSRKSETVGAESVSWVSLVRGRPESIGGSPTADTPTHSQRQTYHQAPDSAMTPAKKGDFNLDRRPPPRELRHLNDVHSRCTPSRPKIRTEPLIQICSMKNIQSIENTNQVGTSPHGEHGSEFGSREPSRNSISITPTNFYASSRVLQSPPSPDNPNQPSPPPAHEA